MQRVRIFRPQDRGYRHKGWELSDDGPSKESMATATRISNSSETIETSLHIRRKINLNSDRVRAISTFLWGVENMNPAYVATNPKSVKQLSELDVTYFGGISLRQAIAKSSRRAYERFGTDPKKTRDIVNSLKGAFGDYIRDARVIQTSFEDPVCLGSWDNQSLVNSHLSEVQDNAKKWNSTNATIDPTVLLLGANRNGYFAFDLDHNDFLHSEKDGIREFFKSEHGLVLEDVEHYQNGEKVPHKFHSTFAKVALEDIVLYNFDVPEVPTDFPMSGVGMEARAFIHPKRSK